MTCHVTSFAESIASSIGWTGDPSELVAGLCDSGWLDLNQDGSIEAHDWGEKQQKVASKAEKDRERQRNYRAKKKAELSQIVTRDMRDSHGATNVIVTPQRDGTGRDVTVQLEALRVAPATPPQPLELVSPPQPKPPKPPKAAKADTDPRHHPLVAALKAAGATIDGGRDAANVTALLALATQSVGPEAASAEVEARWRRALAHEGYPTVRTIQELRTHWGHFADTNEPSLVGRGPIRATITAGGDF